MHGTRMHRVFLVVLGGAMLAAAAGCADAEVRRVRPDRVAEVRYEASCPPAAFAAEEIGCALRGAGWDAVAVLPLGETGPAGAPRAALRIVLEARGAPGDLGPQGYRVERSAGTIRVVGSDPAGAMYGGLDVAETIRLQGPDAVTTRQARPAIARRGVKFNIPLDARTPSYDDSGDAAQKNIVHMWDFGFWQAYLDGMARARYNVLTLWNPHPFPSMLRLEKYPGVALADVCVSKVRPTARHGSIGEHMGVSKEVLANVEVVRRMTIDEKVAFWRRVMKHARDRGIDVYVITWNVLTNSAGGKHGIDDRQDNPATIAYLRECVREFILTYPDLSGLGVTAGERMQKRDDEFAKEKWLWRAYGEGVLDAKRDQPGRTVRFIHRIWQTSVDEVMAQFGSKYPDPFDLGFKYARARLYASPRPPFAAALCEQMKPHGLKCWWNLRNDDIFVFRWGDPDYVREFLRNLPPEDRTAGYYVGSDGYVWGREFAGIDADSPRQLEIDKHWYAFTLWGRLGYDPGLDRAFFERLLASRLRGVPAAALYDAWAEASRIIPLVNRFHWRDWDYLWAVEGCMDQPKGFHTVRDFIANPTMEASGLVTIREFVDRRARGEPAGGTTPPEVADQLQRHAEAALDGLVSLRRDAGPAPAGEVARTLDDIEAMAHLGRYYAAKIRGAVELATFEKTADAPFRQAAVRRLEEAVTHWEAYARLATRRYRPQLLARTRDLDWMRLLEDVRKDVEIARSAAR